jgi:hypothetical protein
METTPMRRVITEAMIETLRLAIRPRIAKK